MVFRRKAGYENKTRAKILVKTGVVKDQQKDRQTELKSNVPSLMNPVTNKSVGSTGYK